MGVFGDAIMVLWESGEAKELVIGKRLWLLRAVLQSAERENFIGWTQSLQGIYWIEPASGDRNQDHELGNWSVPSMKMSSNQLPASSRYAPFFRPNQKRRRTNPKMRPIELD